MKDSILVVVIFMLLLSCEKDDTDFPNDIDFKQEKSDSD